MRTVPAFLLAAALWPSSLDAAERPGAAAEKALIEGKLAEGEKALTEILTVTSNDAEARFGLGAIRSPEADRNRRPEAVTGRSGGRLANAPTIVQKRGAHRRRRLATP